MTEQTSDTIVAIATPPGKGGVGIVRVSGSKVPELAEAVLRFKPAPRHAHYCPFYETLSTGTVPAATTQAMSHSNSVNSHSGTNQYQQLDKGIALLFPAPHSFTGEDVLELQGHGGPVILDLLMQQFLGLGARLARPGEFSERAFLNDKIDLVQAEATADLVEASTAEAARSAVRSLQGVFSEQINLLVEQLIQLRIFVEAAIDFPEEEIDFLGDGKIATDIDQLSDRIDLILGEARQGAILRDGMTVVIAGRPNAGKSSLLNALAGKDSAIVTDVEGTTRDVLREQINIDGMPLHIVDTAGLRESEDIVEKIGIEKAWQEIDKADRILFLVDATTSKANHPRQVWPEFYQRLNDDKRITMIRNKADLSGEVVRVDAVNPVVIHLSAKQGFGIDLLRDHLKQSMGYESARETSFLARRRHLQALKNARQHIADAQRQLSHGAGELVADELRLAQQHLAEITGSFTSDDLLGRIFSSFCIGK